MTLEEKREELAEITDDLSDALDSINDCMHRLEEIRLKRYANRLDTVSGKLYNIMWDLCHLK